MGINRGEIWITNIDYFEGGTSIQKGLRPCIVVSNDLCNRFSPIITVVPITSKNKRVLPTHVIIGEESGLKCESIALCEQILSIDKTKVLNKVGECTTEILKEIDKKLMLQVNIDITDLFRLINKINEASEYQNKYNKNIEKEINILYKQLVSWCKDLKIDFSSIAKLLKIQEVNIDVG